LIYTLNQAVLSKEQVFPLSPLQNRARCFDTYARLLVMVRPLTRRLMFLSSTAPGVQRCPAIFAPLTSPQITTHTGLQNKSAEIFT
jgi:hypothetical protein